MNDYEKKGIHMKREKVEKNLMEKYLKEIEEQDDIDSAASLTLKNNERKAHFDRNYKDL